MLKYLTALTCVVILGVVSLGIDSGAKNNYNAEKSSKEMYKPPINPYPKGINPKNTC